MAYCISIQVAPYLLTYIKENTNFENGSIKVKGDGVIDYFIINAIEKGYPQNPRTPNLLLELKDRYFGKNSKAILDTRPGYRYMSVENQNKLSDFIEYLMIKELFDYIDGRSVSAESHGYIKNSINEFILKYDLADHFNYERLKKAYYRRRKSPKPSLSKGLRKNVNFCPENIANNHHKPSYR